MRSLSFVPLCFAMACSSSDSVPSDAGAGDGGVVPVPQSASCTGDTSACVGGSITTGSFVSAAAKVELYKLFPYGDVKPVASTPVAKDGTFAISNLEAGRFYAEAVLKIDDATAVASVYGPFEVPGQNDKLKLDVKPVRLEVLERRVGNDPRNLTWASARLYDPKTGKPVPDATVGLESPRTPMPFATNLAGNQSYFVQLPGGTPALDSYGIETAYAGQTKLWKLLPARAEYFAELVSPRNQDTITVNQALEVTWKPETKADYVLVSLYQRQGSAFTARYASRTAIAPTTTNETIPATAIPEAGDYVLNVEMARASCPLTSDGCVYSTITAAADLKAK
jgi:hypothetical protein